MLNKIKKIPLKKIETKEGDIIKYIDKEKKYFNKFGEIYFSKIKKGHVKGWNLHKRTRCYLTVPYGSISFVFKDLNMTKYKKIRINDANPQLLIIPKNIWFKFWTSKKFSILANLIEIKHNKKETRKFPLI
tara:strand:+ start:77 stop:469 length:393 start_codon:yes stop_codon:yes gene_type:complete